MAVSRALRGYSDISKDTADRIKKIAEEIGYTTNAYARALSSKQGINCIGMIVPSIKSETAYSMDYEAICFEAAKDSIHVLLGTSNRDMEQEEVLCRTMCENRVRALLVSPVTSDVSHIKKICKNIAPVIFIGGKTGIEEEYCITMDYSYGLNTAVRYLSSLGHRNIAYAAYGPDNNTIRQKIKGYECEMLASKLVPAVYWEGRSDDTFGAGKTIVKRLVEEKMLPTAFCASSDLMALGIIEELKLNGFCVPVDVSVIGHDDIYLSKLPSISLTTLYVSHTEIAEKSLAIVKRIIDGKNIDDSEKKYILTANLIERQSTCAVSVSLPN